MQSPDGEEVDANAHMTIVGTPVLLPPIPGSDACTVDDEVNGEALKKNEKALSVDKKEEKKPVVKKAEKVEEKKVEKKEESKSVGKKTTEKKTDKKVEEKKLGKKEENNNDDAKFSTITRRIAAAEDAATPAPAPAPHVAMVVIEEQQLVAVAAATTKEVNDTPSVTKKFDTVEDEL